MVSDICIFKRIEKKYLINRRQYDMLLSLINGKLTPDEHGRSTICSLYLDTPNFLIIRNSIDARNYKEKLRLRSYGTPTPDGKVFLEIKKKFNGVVYKRRVSMTYNQAIDCIYNGNKPFDSQIMRELDYSMKFYNHPTPKVLVSYERDAFYDANDPALRLTFDSNIRYRYEENLKMTDGSHGKKIIPDDTFILEIKTAGSMPLWLSSALDKCGIFPGSFSKYGTAFREISDGKYQSVKKTG